MISLLIVISLFAGILGSLLGLGGGIIIVPTLTLLFDVHIKYALAASLISVIATSSSAASSYLDQKLTNIRLSVFLEIGTVSGAIVGFFIASYLPANILYILFGFFLIFSSALMLRKREESSNIENHSWNEKFKLNSTKDYPISHLPFGLATMFFSGILSAILGIGSGIFKVVAMDAAMKLPLKVSSATSNFMIGVTAAASAVAYFIQGQVKPEIAAPVCLGIIIGSQIGTMIMPKIKTEMMRKIFVIVLLIVGSKMMYQGIKLWN